MCARTCVCERERKIESECIGVAVLNIEIRISTLLSIVINFFLSKDTCLTISSFSTKNIFLVVSHLFLFFE